MVLYIWLLWHQMVIYCTQGAGCMQVSMGHFDYLLSIGALEMILEISGIIKIFTKKSNGEVKKENVNNIDSKSETS